MRPPHDARNRIGQTAASPEALKNIAAVARRRHGAGDGDQAEAGAIFSVLMPAMSTMAAASGGGPDVLVDLEKVRWIIFALQRREPRIVGTVGRLEPGVALVVHHEVRVRAAEIERVHRVPIGLGPARDRPRLLGF